MKTEYLKITIPDSEPQDLLSEVINDMIGMGVKVEIIHRPTDEEIFNIADAEHWDAATFCSGAMWVIDQIFGEDAK